MSFTTMETAATIPMLDSVEFNRCEEQGAEEVEMHRELNGRCVCELSKDID